MCIGLLDRKEFLAQNVKAKSTAKAAKKDAEAAEEDGAEEADDVEHEVEAEETVADVAEEEEEEEEVQENGTFLRNTINVYFLFFFLNMYDLFFRWADNKEEEAYWYGDRRGQASWRGRCRWSWR